jgi:hypothetical protein
MLRQTEKRQAQRKMPDDPILNPPKDALPEPETKGRRPVRVRCDFCECELGADGGVLKTSEKARTLERAEREINDLQGRLETAKQELEALKAPKPEPSEPTNGPSQDKRPAKSAFSWLSH